MYNLWCLPVQPVLFFKNFLKICFSWEDFHILVSIKYALLYRCCAILGYKNDNLEWKHLFFLESLVRLYKKKKKRRFNFYFPWTFDAWSVMPKWLILELPFHLTADFSNCTNIRVLTWIGLEHAAFYEDTVNSGSQWKFARKSLVLMQFQCPVCVSQKIRKYVVHSKHKKPPENPWNVELQNEGILALKEAQISGFKKLFTTLGVSDEWDCFASKS